MCILFRDYTSEDLLQDLIKVSSEFFAPISEIRLLKHLYCRNRLNFAKLRKLFTGFFEELQILGRRGQHILDAFDWNPCVHNDHRRRVWSSQTVPQNDQTQKGTHNRTQGSMHALTIALELNFSRLTDSIK